jgi:rhodanese-related sulfurtransferase
MKTIDARNLKAHLDHRNDVLILDVLPAGHFEAQHLPGATNIPLSTSRFVDAVAALASSREQPVVVYCAGPDCDLSPKAVERLERGGFRNVTDFKGGLQEWRDAGFDLVTD